MNCIAMINIVMHTLDWVSDVLYLVFVPKYNDYFVYAFVISLMIPIILTVCFVFCSEDVKEHKCYEKIMMILMIMFNVVSQM